MYVCMYVLEDKVDGTGGNQTHVLKTQQPNGPEPALRAVYTRGNYGDSGNRSGFNPLSGDHMVPEGRSAEK